MKNRTLKYDAVIIEQYMVMLHFNCKSFRENSNKDESYTLYDIG